MAYITYQQYLDLYGTCPISEDEFSVYAGLASDLIDSITQYRIVEGGGISALPSMLQTLVQKAAAAQVLYFTQIGLETVLTGQTGQSFTVGKVSVSGGALSSTTTKPGALMVSPFTLSLLEQTTLMERGVHVCSDRFLNPFWGI
jgi:hypothetical protein